MPGIKISKPTLRGLKGKLGAVGGGLRDIGEGLRGVAEDLPRLDLGDVAAVSGMDAPITAGKFILENIDRPRGALVGAYTESKREQLVGGGIGEQVAEFGRGLVGGFREPGEYRGIDIPGVQELPDEGPQLGPLHLTPRTVAGTAADVALDPLTYTGISAAKRAPAALKAIDERALTKLPGSMGTGAAVQSIERRGIGPAQAAEATEEATELIPSDPVGKLITAIKSSKPLQEQNKELLHQFRRRQAGGFAGALGEGEAGFHRALGAMRGQAERVGFPPLRQALDQPGVDELYGRLSRAGLSTFDHANAGHALGNLLDGVVPVPSELEELEKAMPGISKALQDAKIIGGPGLGAYVRDVLSLPQSVKSAFDLSGLRQTATYAAAHPVQWGKNFKQSLSAAGKEANFARIQDDLTKRWYAELRNDAGVVISKGEAGLTRGERTLVATLINKVPGYRQSQRAYTSLINLSRDSLFADMLKNSGLAADEIPAAELRRWGRLVNVATGRGDPVLIGNMINESKVAGTPLFWAPRLVLSRIQMPFELFSSSAVVRKEAAKQMVAFVGINSTILGAGAKAGVWDVETDPRSADFGQVRIGDQRIDPWAGFRPIANLVARLATGQKKSTTSGDVYSVDQKQILQDFLRMKLSPVTATGINLWTGENAIGEDYGAKNIPGDLLVPLFLNDIWEAIQSGDWQAGARSLVAGIGLGVNTYGLDSESKGQFGRAWQDLSLEERDAIAIAHPKRAKDVINAVGWFSRDDLIWEAAQEQSSIKELKNFKSYADWRKQALEDARQAFLDAGYPDFIARQRAEKAVDNSEPSKRMANGRASYKKQMLQRAPHIAKAISELGWGFESQADVEAIRKAVGQ